MEIISEAEGKNRKQKQSIYKHKTNVLYFKENKTTYNGSAGKCLL